MTFKLTTLVQTGAALDKISAADLKTHLEAEIPKWDPVIKKTGVFAD
jgi:tripartite-type tricarboxylate transporter receptor subunit TctC